MWSSNFLVEIAVKDGVFLAVPRPYRGMRQGKTRETLQVVRYWHVLSMQQKLLEKKRMDSSRNFRWCISYYTLPLYGWIYIYSHQSPQRKIQKWTHVARIFPRGISYVTLGLSGLFLNRMTLWLDWYVVRRGSKSKYHNNTCLREIGRHLWIFISRFQEWTYWGGPVYAVQESSNMHCG